MRSHDGAFRGGCRPGRRGGGSRCRRR
jgi:hypothetical protein